MKQRIRVVGLTEKEGSVLLMKRKMKRLDSSAPIWELPTGKINFGEQPEEAIARIFYEYLGVQINSLELKDVVTFSILDGSSRLGNLYIIFKVDIGDKKILASERYSGYKFVKFGNGEDHGIRLDEASLMILDLDSENSSDEYSYSKAYRETMNGATVYIDGCSRGNPGPAGVGYYIIGEDGSVLKEGGEFIGFATSRVAEYYAMKEGCEQAIELGLKSVRFVSDNLMMVNQLNGVYKIKNKDLVPIFDDIKKLLNNFDSCAFIYVKREQNEKADKAANLAVDRHFSSDMLE